MGGIIDGIFGGGDDASDAVREGTDKNLAFQQQAFDTIWDDTEEARKWRDKAQGMLGEMFTGDPTSNPAYQAQLGQINQMGTDAQKMMQGNAAVTGGIRGGNYQAGLGDIATQQNLARQQALGNAYNAQISGLTGLSGLNTGAGQMAGIYGNMGQTAQQGIIGANQAQQAGNQAGLNNILGIAGTAAMFSDQNLKDNITKNGTTNHPDINQYSWTWNDKAEKIGLNGESFGLLAQEVEKVYPDLVITAPNGYKMIKRQAYEVLGANHGN